ncbi:MAG: DUF1028 domain-containing protein [Armatimonadota bacterium]
MGMIAATFSILGRDEETGHLGSAAASRYPAVGAVVPHFAIGVGAVNTQHSHHPPLAWKALELLREGAPPEEALKQILAGDARPESRQLLILDAQGQCAAHTGDRCAAAHHHVVAEDCVAAGNTLAAEAVIEAMVEAFLGSSGERLDVRLLRALEAGEEAGGDRRGKQAAAVRVMPPSEDGWNERVCLDLRVDDHEEPIAELLRLRRVKTGEEIR